MLIRRRLPLVVSLLAGTAFASPAFAACNVIGSVTFTDGCGKPGPGILGAATASSTVTISNEVIDDLNDTPSVNSYIGLRADYGVLTPIDIEVSLQGTTIKSHNYLGVDLRSRFGDVGLVIDKDTTIEAAHSGVYILTDANDDGDDDDTNGTTTPYDGGDITVENSGTIIAGEGGVMGANGIWAVANAGSVRIDNYGTVDATAADFEAVYNGSGRGLYADTGSLSIGRTSSTVYNNGTVDAAHDGIRVNARNGTGTAINDVDGVVTGHSRRGIAVWAQDYNAVIDNRGIVSALEGTGVIAWGAKGATVTNSGTITGANGNSKDSNDVTFDGALIWADGGGIAKLDNRAGGSISSKDGYGAWLMSNSESGKNGIVVDNAGTISGKTTAIYVSADGVFEAYDDKTTLADYDGLIGGNITITNSGLITADTTSAKGDLGIITLAGRDIGKLTLTNLAGGLIGAGFDIQDFDPNSLEGLSALPPAAANMAITVAADVDEGNIDNRGTLVGRVGVMTPADLYPGLGAPTQTGRVVISNDGLWVTQGQSGGYDDVASFSNTGTIIALGETRLVGDISNFGTMRITGLADAPGGTIIDGEYVAYPGKAQMVFDWADAPSTLRVNGVVFGRSNVSVANGALLDGWDWSSNAPLTLITAEEGDAEAAAFSMDQNVGLARYTLDYARDDDDSWTVVRLVSTDSSAALGDIALATRGLLDVSTEATLERARQLRDGAGPSGGGGADPAALTLAEPGGGSSVQAWFKSAGDLSTGGGFDMARGALQAGIDGSNDAGAGFGGFVTGAVAGLDFNAPDTSAVLNGTAAGLYASVGGDEGFFVNGTVAAQLIGVDLTLAGIATEFGGVSYGAQVEAGYSLQQNDIRIEPSVVLKADRTTFDTVDAGALSAGFSGTDRVAAEAHLRVSGLMVTETYLLRPYAELVAGNALGGTDSVTVSAFDSTIDGNHGGLYGSLTAGLEADSADGRSTGFLQGSVGTGAGRVSGGIKLGGEVRF